MLTARPAHKWSSTCTVKMDSVQTASVRPKYVTLTAKTLGAEELGQLISAVVPPLLGPWFEFTFSPGFIFDLRHIGWNVELVRCRVKAYTGKNYLRKAPFMVGMYTKRQYYYI